VFERLPCINRGFQQCTAPAAVAQALRNTLAADRKLDGVDAIKDVFVMSDEKHTSPWWKELLAAIKARTPQQKVPAIVPQLPQITTKLSSSPLR